MIDRLALAMLLLTACAPSEAVDDTVAAGGVDGPVATDTSDGKADSTSAGRTYRLQIAHPAFDIPVGKPGVVVYVPRHFDPTPPVDVVVFLHGFYNCVDNVLGSRNSPCRAGGPARQAYGLAAQLEAATKNALLILPETTVDQASSQPGRLADNDGFGVILDETLAQLDLGRKLGRADLGRIVVATHSGGHHAAIAIAEYGGVDVSELYLLDSLYGEYDDYDAWVQEDLPSLVKSERRFASVYSQAAGTLVANQAMASRAQTWLSDAYLPASALVDDRTTATLSDNALKKGLLWKRSGLSHDGIPRFYFGKLVAQSGLRDGH